MNVNVPYLDRDPDPYVFGPPGSVTQRYGSEDPYSYQNGTDPQYCLGEFLNLLMARCRFNLLSISITCQTPWVAYQ
jgi:hypothetical protein